MALTSVASGMAKKAPHTPQTEPNTSTAKMIATG